MRSDIIFSICAVIMAIILTWHILCQRISSIFLSWLGLMALTCSFLLLFHWIDHRADSFLAFFLLLMFLPFQLVVGLIAFATAAKKGIRLDRSSLLWIISGMGLMIIFVFNSISFPGF